MNQNHLCYHYTIRLHVFRRDITIMRKREKSNQKQEKNADFPEKTQSGDAAVKNSEPDSDRRRSLQTEHVLVAELAGDVVLLTDPVFHHGLQNEILQFDIDFKPVIAEGTA